MNSVRFAIPVQGEPAGNGLTYPDPQNSQATVQESNTPPVFELPAVVKEVNRHYPKRQPSMNLAIKENGVPLQYKTYNQEDSRLGSMEFNAPFVIPKKLKYVGENETTNYLDGLTPADLN